jgi:hypothetical protein
MDDAHGPPEGQQEIHDAFQAYHTHEGYLDPAQAQAIANYMPDFAGMDPASQAAAMQQYHPDMATGAEGQERGNIDDIQQGQQSDSDIELEEGVDAGELLVHTG